MTITDPRTDERFNTHWRVRREDGSFLFFKREKGARDFYDRYQGNAALYAPGPRIPRQIKFKGGLR